jgi:hypothetical protein
MPMLLIPDIAVFTEEARHPSAHELPGRRDRAQRRLNNRPAADP